jgi:ligand-binding sensor domain-containing protein/serine phosphatase RsbU (regulator of sigma subunit)
MRRLKLLAIVLILAFWHFPQINAQSYKFKHYGIEDGLCHPFVYSLIQDKNGYLWIGTGESLCRYDGFSFSAFHGKDSISQSFVNCSFKDKHNNLWLGHNDGSITYYDGNHFVFINSRSQISSPINDFLEEDNGTILALTQNDGIIVIDKEHHYKIVKKGLENLMLFSLNKTSNDKLLIGTANGIYVLAAKNLNSGSLNLSRLSKAPFTRINCIIKKKNSDSFWVGTEDMGFFLLTENKQGIAIENFGEKYGISTDNVQHVMEDRDLNLWICTFGKGLLKVIRNTTTGKYQSFVHYTQENGLSGMFIKNVYQDGEGNIWVGTYGNGMERLLDEAFMFYHFDKLKLGKNILSVFADEKDVWLGGEKYLMKFDRDKHLTNTNANIQGLPEDHITSICKDSKGNMWIGTETHGAYLMVSGHNSASHLLFSQNSLENSVNNITTKGSYVYVSTKNGIFQYDISHNTKKHFTTIEGLPHNNIMMTYPAKNNDVWISTKTSFLYSLNKSNHYKYFKNNVELEMKAMSEDIAGNLWIASYGDGVFKLGKDTSFRFVTENNLKSNYCYALLFDGISDMWVGHRLGLSRINSLTNQVKTYGTETGITGDCNPNAASINKGVLYFGTTDGLIEYDVNKDKKNQVAPIPNITSITLSDKEIEINGNQIVLPYGIYKLKIDYVGINFKSPDQVKYQYKLDNYDLDWSEITSSRSALYSRIEDGEYHFLLKAYNADGFGPKEPLVFTIIIKPPFWKTWWFVSLAILIVIGSIYSFMKYRERKQIQIQLKLQQMLDDRTKEVVEQKELIEHKNRDITESINYAQRIQASVLPPINRLKDNFTGAFVFYKPRDIVSGDFYWFDKFGEDKFIIVCGDSTGHGVPGAFMSMIGTTLIKDICGRRQISSPSEILQLLNYEINNTLNQNVDVAKSNDGMDIIVCEINLTTFNVRFASAMRPLIIFRNGEELYTKGSKVSLGSEATDDQEFTVDEVLLNKGDIIYMFSDGYPDQFGGPLGKKFKMVRLKNMLKEIHRMPMDDQLIQIRTNFELWKEGYDQVDDLLFMGIKL